MIGADSGEHLAVVLAGTHTWRNSELERICPRPLLPVAGRPLIWYGLNWSLDLYEQFNARVRRQGQGVPVICHRILMQATLDQAQALALDEKATTQAGLRNAVKQYRLTKGA